MKKFDYLFLGAFLFWHVAVPAAPSFQADKNLPSLGLKMRVLGNANPEPLPPPKVHSYTVTRGEEKTSYDAFSVRELWYASQHAGQWRDAAGNSMIVAQPTVQLPKIDRQFGDADHVTRDTYEKVVKTSEGALGAASSEEALSAWVASFTGTAPTGVEKLRTGQNLSLTDALFFPSPDTKTLAWVFRVKVRTPGGQVKPSGWYATVLQVNDGSPPQKVRQEFEAQFFKGVAAVSPTAATPVNAPKRAAGQPGNPPPVDGSSISGRDDAIKSIENMEGWWYAEAANYIFLSNIKGAAGKSLIRDLQNTLPTLRQGFAKTVEPFSDKEEVNVVRIFESKEAYANYVGEGMEWSAGCWVPSRRELCILSQGAQGTDKAEKERTVVIVRHEAFHQYLFYASGGIQDAVWYNEGHACFFEAAEIDAQKRVEVKESHQKRTLMNNLDAAVDNIAFILKANHAQFYAGDEKTRNLNYATAWGLVYFLHCGTSSGKPTAYANILTKYRTALKETKNAETATQQAFEDTDMKAFQAAFLDFWRKGGTSKRFRVN
ncbi:MAG: DUF1570 domain-containing protein [Kiritimatiellaeota bacterium]|nr:DUF1570 domain-containing protein [Kiritimatiellota bacterium]